MFDAKNVGKKHDISHQFDSFVMQIHTVTSPHFPLVLTAFKGHTVTTEH